MYFFRSLYIFVGTAEFNNSLACKSIYTFFVATEKLYTVFRQQYLRKMYKLRKKYIYTFFAVYTLFRCITVWAASSEFGPYRLCEQRRFRRACASAQSRQNLRCSLIQAVSQEEPSDRKQDPWPLWMAGHAQLKFVMTECSKTQIRLTRPV